MAVYIVSPDYSFVQMQAPGNCGFENCLPASRRIPVVTPADLAFQMIAEVSFADENWFLQTYSAGITYTGDTGAGPGGSLLYSTIAARICQDCDDVGDPTTFDYQYTGTFVQTVTGTQAQYAGFFQYNYAANDWNNLPTGSCFNLCFYKLSYIKTPGSPIAGKLVEAVKLSATPDPNVFNDCPYICTYTQFYKSDDDCYTSVIQYANNSDAFLFLYDILTPLAPDYIFYNTVRLPFYLHSPSYTEEQMTYQQSNGLSVKLSHRIWKDYKLKTDYWYDEWVQRFVVATAHDTVMITCPYANIVSQYFVRTEKIDTEWYQEETPDVLKGISKGVLRVAEVAGFINSNCE